MTGERDGPNRIAALFERVVMLATGRNQPTDPAEAVLSAAEQGMVEGPAGPTIPNIFVIARGDPAEGAERARTEGHLEEVVALAAIHRGRRFDGPIEVRLAPGGARPEVATSFEAGDLPAWGVLTAAEADETLPIGPNRALIGRSREADVTLSGEGVSRIHALMWREAGLVWIADLQSANGSFVNDHPVYDVVEVRPGDTVRFGNAAYVFAMA